MFKRFRKADFPIGLFDPLERITPGSKNPESRISFSLYETVPFCFLYGPSFLDILWYTFFMIVCYRVYFNICQPNISAQKISKTLQWTALFIWLLVWRVWFYQNLIQDLWNQENLIRLRCDWNCRLWGTSYGAWFFSHFKFLLHVK